MRMLLQFAELKHAGELEVAMVVLEARLVVHGQAHSRDGRNVVPWVKILAISTCASVTISHPSMGPYLRLLSGLMLSLGLHTMQAAASW